MRFFVFVIFSACSLSLHAQLKTSQNIFLNENTQQAMEFWNIQNPSSRFHSSFKPYLTNSVPRNADSLVPFTHQGFSGNVSTSLNNNELQLFPLADLESGYDGLSRSIIASAAAGACVRYNPGRFALSACFIGGSAQLPFYADTLLGKKNILPEYGQAYRSKSGAYNFSNFTGYASYTTSNKVFNFQLGRDKHFIGEGYRSVLMSDYAPASPYAGINARIWKLQYNIWYNFMCDVESAAQKKSAFRNKYGTFHYLSFNASKNFNVGVFENVIWRGSDTSQSRIFDANYLSPVVFFRPIEYSLHSPDNSFLGVNLSATVLRRIKLYAQLGLDEFYLKEIRAHRGWWANKQAWQAGAKYVNPFGIRGAKIQVEYNEVRPYTYSHGLEDQNYGHYGMPLAHPLGANFREFQIILLLRRDKWSVQNQLMYAITGKDTSETSKSMGQDIFRSYNDRPYEYGHYTGQGIKTTIIQNHLKMTWYLQQDMNLRLEAGYIQRMEKNSRGYLLENAYFYLALRSTLWNNYRDF